LSGLPYLFHLLFLFGLVFLLEPDHFAAPFGAIGDIPAPGDYDADGCGDLVVIRPLVATWFIQRSTQWTLIQQFGVSGDKPVQSAFVS
jgi:hypothetical protein